MKFVIFSALLFWGFGCVEPLPPKTIFIVKNKNCIDQCIGKRFGSFHNGGRSWGAGSSSMNGMSQKGTFDTVEKYCRKYYLGERCCEYPYASRYTRRQIMRDTHGAWFGVCVFK